MPAPISVTMLSAYEYCQRKLFLEHVLKLFEPPKESLVLGSIRHETYEGINRIEERLVAGITGKTSFDDLIGIFKKEYSSILRGSIKKFSADLERFSLKQEEVFRRIWHLIIKEAEKRAKNVFSFMEKTGLLGEELWEKLTPKIISEFSINSENLGLKGRIDQIEVYDDFIVPVELKTGKSPNEGAWPGHKLQTLAYMLMLSEKTDEREVKEGRIIYLDADKSVVISLNPFAEKEIKGMVSKVNALLSTPKIPLFCGNENKCNICGLKKECYDEAFLAERLKSPSKAR